METNTPKVVVENKTNGSTKSNTWIWILVTVLSLFVVGLILVYFLYRNGKISKKGKKTTQGPFPGNGNGPSILPIEDPPVLPGNGNGPSILPIEEPPITPGNGDQIFPVPGNNGLLVRESVNVVPVVNQNYPLGFSFN